MRAIKSLTILLLLSFLPTSAWAYAGPGLHRPVLYAGQTIDAGHVSV